MPEASPARLAFGIRFPARVEDVWVPWPSTSIGERMSAGSDTPSSLKNFAPIILLGDNMKVCLKIKSNFFFPWSKMY